MKICVFISFFKCNIQFLNGVLLLVSYQLLQKQSNASYQLDKEFIKMADRIDFYTTPAREKEKEVLACWLTRAAPADW